MAQHIDNTPFSVKKIRAIVVADWLNVPDMLPKLLVRAGYKYSTRQSRSFAREAKKPFEAPPDPPASIIDKIRWPLVAVIFGGIAYIMTLPANDHGLYNQPESRASQRDDKNVA